MLFFKKNFGYIIMIIGIFGLLAYNLYADKTPSDYQAKEYSDSYTYNTADQEVDETVMIDIKGCVKYPGLYQVNSGLRIGDVISICGGLTEEADISSINLAAKIIDEMVIDIPRKSYQTTTGYTPHQNPTSYPDNTQSEEENESKISIIITGAVANPNIYELDDSCKLSDAIIAAGGLTENADIANIDLTKVLTNGEKINIPEKTIAPDMIYVKIEGEVLYPKAYYVNSLISVRDLISLAGGLTEYADVNNINWDMELVLGAVVRIPTINTQTSYSEYDASGKININYAYVETLVDLPGIGEILAQRIIDYRSENGNFLAIEDIMYVSGIKESVYEQIKDLITV